GGERMEGGVSRDLRGAWRASFSTWLRVFTTVLRLHFATLARSVVDPSGVALSAARARSRASLGAWRLYFRFRRAPRARLLDRGRREGCGSKTAGGVSAVRSSGASAPRTVAAVLGCRWRAARFAMIPAITSAGSMTAIPPAGERGRGLLCRRN